MGPDPVAQLTALLREAKAIPRLRAEAVAPSSIYDALYRIIVVALTMSVCGERKVEGALTLPLAKLKLMQFVAVHPELLPSLRGWVTAHVNGERPSLAGWARFPRGYAADTIHDGVLTYLIATGELNPDRKNVNTRSDGRGLLAALTEIAVSKDSFSGERRTLEELSVMKITLKMLGT